MHRNFGIESCKCVLLHIAPDSGCTVVGSLIDEHGSLWTVDIDFIDMLRSDVQRVAVDSNQMQKPGEKIAQEVARKLLA